MNTQQATETILNIFHACIQSENVNMPASATLARQDYMTARFDGQNIGVFDLTDYEIVEHGIESSQYFQGCGVSFTDFEHVNTGCGDTPFDAMEDCLEQIACGGQAEIPETLERVARDYPSEPSACDEDRKNCEDEGITDDYEIAENVANSENNFYLSIRYNRKFNATKTARQFVESIVNGNAGHVVEQLQAMPQSRALSIAARIGARGHCDRIMDRLDTE